MKIKKIQLEYEKSLTKIAKQVGRIVNRYPIDDPNSVKKIDAALTAYAESLTGWAVSTAMSKINAADLADRNMWRANSARISKALKERLANSDMQVIKEELLREQVRLIKSIPLEAAQRVNKLTLEGLVNGTRSNDIVREIMRSGDVAAGRARTIARTETSRTAEKLTEYRAKNIGSEGYIWRTSRAAGTRPSHAEMEGTFVRWSNPPTLDGLTGHAGCLPNCRCWAEPVFPEDD